MFCGTRKLPEVFDICGNHRYRDDCALWHYRQANKLAAVKWGESRKYIEEGIQHFQEKGMTELPFVERTFQKIVEEQGETKANEYLTNYTADFAGATLLRWNQTYRTLWNNYRFGF